MRHSDAIQFNLKIGKTNRRLLGYSDDEVHLAGKCEADFCYNNVRIKHNFSVVPCKNIYLLGCDLCQKLGINFTLSSRDEINNI